MSMLAERKQKQRWSLNPRGKHWSEDVNKFGHKMLEKMGWSAGKGLGAKEDGITEHVKVSYKNDAKGMGFKDNSELWTKHEDNFTSLLSNLGSGIDAKVLTLPTAEKSLEKKSQSSKARVHYKKFTRGKDLSQRSEKDIANIFGRKTLERPVVQSQESKEEICENGTEDKSFGVVTVKAGNMTDYFKSKLGKLGNITSSKGDYALNGRDDYEPEIGACTGFGFASVKENHDENDAPSLGNNKINFVSSQNSKTDVTTGDELSNKKRKRDSEEWTEVAPKKKKKSKKKEMAFDNLGSDINPAEEVCYDNPCLKQTDSPQISENSDEKGKKKRVTFSSPIIEVLNKSDDSNITEKSKKKKKNKKSTNEIDNFGCEYNSFEESNRFSNSEENEKITKKKKNLCMDNDENSVNGAKTKKNKKHQEVGIDNLACEEISVNEKNEEIKRYKMKKKAMEHGLVNPACEESSPIQEMKKKKKKSLENGLDNLGCEEISISEDAEVPTKKRKQKNDSFEISVENISEMSQNDDEAKTKKNKKKDKITEEDEIEKSPPKKLKKKSKSKESGIENLGCEINTVEENIASINSEIDNYQTELENEINVKKAKKQKKRVTENPEETPKNESQKNKTSNKKNKSKGNTIIDNEQSTNEKTNFQKNSNENEKPPENNNSGKKIKNKSIKNKNNKFENKNNKFDNRNPPSKFNDQRGPNNFKRPFNDQRGPNNFNRRSFDNQRGPNSFNRRSFEAPGNRTFNNQRGPNEFNRPFNRNGPWKPVFNPDKVDKSSLKGVLKPGELKLSFAGSNITKIIGYGVAADLVKRNRPEPEPTTEATN